MAPRAAAAHQPQSLLQYTLACTVTEPQGESKIIVIICTCERCTVHMAGEKREGQVGPDTLHLQLVLRQQTLDGLRLIKLNFNQQFLPTSWGGLARGGASNGEKVKKIKSFSSCGRSSGSSRRLHAAKDPVFYSAGRARCQSISSARFSHSPLNGWQPQYTENKNIYLETWKKKCFIKA